MSNGRDHRSDAPETIKSDTNHALRELYNLQQTDPAEFKREVAQINRTTDLSFLANGRQDVEIVGFDNAAAGGTHRLVMQDRKDHSFVRTNYTAEGVRLNDGGSTQRQGDQASQTRIPEGKVVRGENTYDFTYPDGRHIHLDLAPDKTPMTYSQNGHTYERQLDRQGRPSHLWVDRESGKQLLMELQFNKVDGSLTMRIGDNNGNAVGSSKFLLDGSQLDISGDERAGGTRLRAVTTPSDRYMEFPRDLQQGQMVNSFSDGRTQWNRAADGSFVDAGGHKRTDVQALPGGNFSVREGNITTVYRADGTIQKQINAPGGSPVLYPPANPGRR
ncbi:MAG: hypothetical protein JST01_12930 [Cyanobacteria bacterium SZAS TMP-1]|nr:hypothetical protein [Cyanobacteria bacterium SZAS TMP-1]